MTDRDMEALLGAYALDTLDEHERAQVETYLAENPRAQAEVDDLRETVAALAAAPVEETTAPPELWTRIAEEIGDDAAPVVDLTARRERKRTWVAPAIAVAASVVAVVLAAQVVSLQGDLDDAASEPSDANVAAAFEQASEADGARAAELVAPAGDAEVARVVVLPDGRGYMVSDGLAPLPDDMTYQLWAVVPSSGADPKVISAGVLGADPDAASFEVDGDVDAFVLTVEEAGGVEASEQDPYAAGTLA